MLKIKVDSTRIREEKISAGKRAGESVYKQEVLLVREGRAGMPFDVTPPAKDTPYAVGDYALDEDCLRVGPFGGLEIDAYRVRLTKVEAARPARVA